MDNINKKPNWFVRILIILLCLFIGGLIYFNFFWSCPRAQITSGIIILTAFLIVLVLSESFDNFSIGQIIGLSRTVKEKENVNKELKKENQELRNQIINISTSINQRQINSTVIVPDELAKAFSIRKADEPEILQKQAESDEPAEAPEQPQRRYIPLAKVENIALNKFLVAENLNEFPFLRDAKLMTHFQQIDPISEGSPIFDGYINTVDTEIFIEVKTNNRMMLHFKERIYVMLSKIYYYRTTKKVNAFLYLVLMNRVDVDPNINIVERILKEFEPAIVNGLLKIRDIEITQADLDQIQDND